ncbi:type II toxin-antitoxin system VapC family toxin [Endozoicomonas sp. SM1973]|uniref:Type II toxin-antitoxin system VapC family toxin n=1 Tax=Spartinivicinus marinus TaxID=2994442 RepID=A0A853IIG5_9GAMM|nr:type II toxin-antitoxin system VapC family toxin [Spartinivicinus marinus]NYZ69824.1 type II toxin-antitoxin system VapC family toxin [Spartinivicinus marinus]
MSNFVLDNSVAMRWLLETSKIKDQNYADSVLETFSDVDAIVPNLWHLEAVSVLLGAQKRGEITEAEIEIFITQLESLPIEVDMATAHQAFSRTIRLAKLYKLSSYDASYLELAIRNGLPLASLDKDLRKAAKKAGVPLYLED